MNKHFPAENRPASTWVWVQSLARPQFLLEVEAGGPNETLDVRVQYFACDDALTFCIPVRQDYRVHLAWDNRHYWSVQTERDGTYEFGVPEFLRGE